MIIVGSAIAAIVVIGTSRTIWTVARDGYGRVATLPR